VRELRRRNGSEDFKCNLGYLSFGSPRTYQGGGGLASMSAAALSNW